MIEDGSLPVFYVSKLQYQGYGRPTVMLGKLSIHQQTRQFFMTKLENTNGSASVSLIMFIGCTSRCLCKFIYVLINTENGHTCTYLFLYKANVNTSLVLRF